jgi:UDP-glucose 4-epimerase
MLNDKVVLVTGGAGAIGSNLVKTLISKVKKIVVIDDLSSGSKENIPFHSSINFIQGSIVDNEILTTAFKHHIDIVYHLAANFANQNSVEYPETDLITNGMGTLKILQQCEKHKIKLFVYASSSCVYGDMIESGDENSSLISLDTPYAITKWLGEKYTEFFRMQYGLPTVIIRIFNSYGPGEMPGPYRNVIPNFIKLAIEKKALPITGTGEETRAFNYIDNLLQAFILIAEKPEAVGNIFNIGTEKETKIIDIAKIINKISNNESGLEFLPIRKWDHVKRRRANIAKAKLLLNYKPNEELEVNINKTYQWILKEYDKK